MSGGVWWEYDKDIICPYCGKTYTSKNELFIAHNSIDIYANEKIQKCTCEKCGKRFNVIPKIEWHYRTETTLGEGG
jgi:uncharacterized Zn-finger protein